MKRFTATEKWAKQWHQELSPRLKCLWSFICDHADASGVWEPNFRLAGFMIGEDVTESDLASFGDRIEKMESGKFWLPRFIEFQYGKLSVDCRPHLKIFEALNKHGIDYHQGQLTVRRARKPHVSGPKWEAVVARDGRKCVYCGSAESIQVDHVKPCQQGGSDDIGNLVAACGPCNLAKCDRSVIAFLAGNPQKDRVLAYLNTLSEKPEYSTAGRVQEEEEDRNRKEGSAEGAKVDRSPEPEPEPMALAKSLNEAYCALTGNSATLSYQRQQSWCEFIRRGFTEADLALVVRWLKVKIARNEGGFSAQSMQFGALLRDLDRFEDKLSTARASKLPGIAPTRAAKAPPEGWQAYLRANYPDGKISTWEKLPDDLKRECREAITA